MKSSYYDLLDKYYEGFCGTGDTVQVLDEENNIEYGTVCEGSFTTVIVEDESKQKYAVPRTSIVSIHHCIQEKNHIPVEVNDLVAFPQGDDRDIRCLGVIVRPNVPHAKVMILSGQQMSETINVWLKKLQFVAKGFSLDLYEEKEEVEMNFSYNSIPSCLNINVSQQGLNLQEIFNPLMNRAKLYTNPLFRQDVMNNQKLKKWGKDVLRKTKQFTTILSSNTTQDEPTSPNSPLRSSTETPAELEGNVAGSPTTRTKPSLLRRSSSRGDDRKKAGNFSDSDDHRGSPGIFSRFFKGRRESLGEEGKSRFGHSMSLEGIHRHSASHMDSLLDKPHTPKTGRFLASPTRSLSADFRVDSRDSEEHSMEHSMEHSGLSDSDESSELPNQDDGSSVDEGSLLHFATPKISPTFSVYSPLHQTPGYAAGHSRGYMSPPPALSLSPSSELEGNSRSRLDLDLSDDEDFYIDFYPDYWVSSRSQNSNSNSNSNLNSKDSADLIDLSFSGDQDSPSVDITPLPREGSPVSPQSPVFPSSPREADARLLNPLEGPESSEDSDGLENAPECERRIGVARRNHMMKLKNMNMREIPKFQRRVASLPPLPIVAKKDSEEQTYGEKQVRFFTNVIRHEYKSY